MDTDAVDELALLVGRAALWEDGEIESLEGRLLGPAGSPEVTVDVALAHAFRALRLRLGMAPVPERLRRDIEGIFYPRLWKVLEAVREQLPPDEQLARVHVLNRRLARLFADEEPDGSA